MEPLTINLPDQQATEALARRLAGAARPGDAILLSGVLGAGKSVFSRAFLRAACDDPALEVPSPTYTLVQTYDAPGGSIAHFDLWRLDGPEGLHELGWDDACEGIVLVEWPDRLGALAPADALRIELLVTGEETRAARIGGWGGRPVWADLMAGRPA
ncbi:tRNA (adenosine(37)-N6)-threonylcarbamoyltransferase complex ATPase subunit type 1 TsaE [Gluconacetobacter takamatsuzukensis]|uniref:tRNA threonylcarbamoyladenosine biosynthesis protein TsaE n=1 Tax=Gluconacetobacter takamatsuzukensis TaxID=1286190 RepID=A0A7W4PPK2_9PROT|nr:tRNA (adenosine(37)-N6)-threonylcarbamoyltransferase complex ATPase subunit type 1 TsaE [Gluconacetobacter takamatsuzukensis]MBB2205717.1 tRNA (adenosine(37)-N6)-threonylcarbamoyltransferase complex ATPase subunit type 1 TsaE [Gluconacetobacter takamatsuzukensis]